MVDEQQLASLVLLLQLPPNNSVNSPVDNGLKPVGTNNDTGSSTQNSNTISTKQLDDSSSTLQATLEHNNCKL